MSDAAPAIFNGLSIVYPNMKNGRCFFHMMKCMKERHYSDENSKKSFLNDLRSLSKSHCQEHFDVSVNLFLDKYRNNEDKYIICPMRRILCQRTIMADHRPTNCLSHFQHRHVNRDSPWLDSVGFDMSRRMKGPVGCSVCNIDIFRMDTRESVRHQSILTHLCVTEKQVWLSTLLCLPASAASFLGSTEPRTHRERDRRLRSRWILCVSEFHHQWHRIVSSKWSWVELSWVTVIDVIDNFETKCPLKVGLK